MNDANLFVSRSFKNPKNVNLHLEPHFYPKERPLDGYYVVLFTEKQWNHIHLYPEIRALRLRSEQSMQDKLVVKMAETTYDRYLEIQTAINQLGILISRC